MQTFANRLALSRDTALRLWVEPTFVLPKLVLMRTCKRSGKTCAPTSVVLVQNENVLPSRSVIVGMISQLLMSFVSVVLWKLTLA